MTGSHDPADCELAACDSYGDGYAAGKAAAHFETRVWSSPLRLRLQGATPVD